MHRMFQMHVDGLISIFIISEHQVKEYKCLFSRVGNAGVWVQWILGDRAHAKSVNHSIWKMNGMFWSSLPSRLGRVAGAAAGPAGWSGGVC